jgi:hypothetical protein
MLGSSGLSFTWLASPVCVGRILRRVRIFHSAFINFENLDLDNAFVFVGHLSDVLARVVFHLISFAGQYRPPCGYMGSLSYQTPDWATPERLTAEVFGYAS